MCVSKPRKIHKTTRRKEIEAPRGERVKAIDESRKGALSLARGQIPGDDGVARSSYPRARRSLSLSLCKGTGNPEEVEEEGKGVAAVAVTLRVVN